MPVFLYAYDVFARLALGRTLARRTGTSRGFCCCAMRDMLCFVVPTFCAQHAVHRRESSEETSGSGAIAGAWATREDLLETKKVSPHEAELVLEAD